MAKSASWATCGVDKARDRDSRASPTRSAASQIRLHLPDTMASIARRTLAEMRFCGPADSAGAGVSSTASARLAGVPGGVMFSMLGTVGAWRRCATYRNVTFCRVTVAVVEVGEAGGSLLPDQ